MPSIQKQISLIFNKKKQQIFVDYFTYYIDLDNNLYEITVENHEPIIHNKITKCCRKAPSFSSGDIRQLF